MGEAHVTLVETAAAAIVAHARRDAPHECCGLLIGDGHRIVAARPAANLADAPLRRYLIDPRDHLAAIRHARRLDLDVVGAYHSHPRSPAVPSETDAAEAFGEFLFLIVSLAGREPELAGWRWDEGNFTRVRLVR